MRFYFKLIFMVGLDIDGVLADFLSPFLLVLENRIGRGPIPAESITDFQFTNHSFLTKEAVWDCMLEVSHDADFWRALSPLIRSEEWRDLEVLSQRGELVFVTNRFERNTYDIRAVTREWLQRHGIIHPIVHFTQETKGDLVAKLGIKLFMDDRHENCVDVANKTTAVVLMPHRSYNQSFDHPRVKRVWDFRELFSHLPNGGFANHHCR